jgi:hypothetical protein
LVPARLDSSDGQVAGFALDAHAVADRDGVADPGHALFQAATDRSRLLAALDTARGSDQLVGDREALVTATRVRQQVAQLLTERGQAAVTTIASQRALEAAAAVVAS